MGDKTVIGTINVPREITVEDVGYILCGCFEGGSNYWIDKVSVDDFKGESHASDVPGAGGEVFVFIQGFDEKETAPHTLTLNSILDGLSHYYKNSNNPMAIEDMDAGDYDEVLQYGLFGDVVYA
jgi:hypothetical protein